jgi:hypothetical protein
VTSSGPGSVVVVLSVVVVATVDVVVDVVS